MHLMLPLATYIRRLGERVGVARGFSEHAQS